VKRLRFKDRFLEEMELTGRSNGRDTDLWMCWDNYAQSLHAVTFTPANVRQLREALAAREAELVAAGFLEDEEEVTR
jgi:hypothetical protein